MKVHTPRRWLAARIRKRRDQLDRASRKLAQVYLEKHASTQPPTPVPPGNPSPNPKKKP